MLHRQTQAFFLCWNSSALSSPCPVMTGCTSGTAQPNRTDRSLRRETTDSGRPVENQKHFNLIGPQPCYVEARELAGQRNSAVSCSITVGCCWMKRKTEKNRHCHVNSGIDLFHKQTKLKWDPCFMAQCREHCCSKVARSKILSEWFIESSVI